MRVSRVWEFPQRVPGNRVKATVWMGVGRVFGAGVVSGRLCEIWIHARICSRNFTGTRDQESSDE